MKKLVTFLLLLAMTLSVTSCNNKQETTSQPESSVQQESSITTESNTAETEQPQTVSPTKLTNKMTEMERDMVSKHELTLLDNIEKPDINATEHKVSIEFTTLDIERMRAYLEETRDEMDEAQYNAGMKRLEKAEKEGGEYRVPLRVLVDGYILPINIPDEYDFYDGASYTYDFPVTREDGFTEYKTHYF